MKNKKLPNTQTATKLIVLCFAATLLCGSVTNTLKAQTSSENQPALTPELQNVVKLSQAHMSDEVIINYIKGSGRSYKLSADDIIYLNNQGISQAVISILQTTQGAAPTLPSPPPSAMPLSEKVSTPIDSGLTASTETGPPPSDVEVNFDYFHDQLAPFGTWVSIDGTMYWRPDQAINSNPDWRPYYDMGQWVQTDNGLFWQSDYTWGDIPFHYGRWVQHPDRGWLWTPDYTWGPSWVFWRHSEADGAIGWAPLPVGADFVDGALIFNGVVVAADFDFGVGEDYFTFVDYDHFHENFFRMRNHEWAHHIDTDRRHGFYKHSVVRNEFGKDEHGRFVNNGIGRDRLARATKGRVASSKFEERSPVGDRNKLAETRNKPHTQQVHEGAGQGAGSKSFGKAAPVNKVFRPAVTGKQSAPAKSSSGGSGKKK